MQLSYFKNISDSDHFLTVQLGFIVKWTTFDFPLSQEDCQDRVRGSPKTEPDSLLYPL